MLLTLQQQPSCSSPRLLLSCHTPTAIFYSKLRSTGAQGAATQDATTRRLQALLPRVSHKHITELTIDYVSMVIFELLHSKASSLGMICA